MEATEVISIKAKDEDSYNERLEPEKLDSKGLPLIPQPSDDPEDVSF